MNAAACPVDLRPVDAAAARLTGLLVAAVTALFLATGFAPAILALVPDFVARAAGRPAASPLARIAAAMSRALRLPRRPTDGAPKRFAAGIGAAFSLGAGALALAGATAAASVVAAILLACALLEGLLGFCVGCRVYALLPRRLTLLRQA